MSQEEKKEGEDGGGQITMSSMMKEIQGLKEKFKGDDDESCKYSPVLADPEI